MFREGPLRRFLREQFGGEEGKYELWLFKARQLVGTYKQCLRAASNYPDEDWVIYYQDKAVVMGYKHKP